MLSRVAVNLEQSPNFKMLLFGYQSISIENLFFVRCRVRFSLQKVFIFYCLTMMNSLYILLSSGKAKICTAVECAIEHVRKFINRVETSVVSGRDMNMNTVTVIKILLGGTQQYEIAGK